MVNNVYDLVTRTMEQEFPGRVAFRWVEDATGTVKENHQRILFALLLIFRCQQAIRQRVTAL